MAAAAPAAYSPCPPAAARLPAPAGHHGAIYSLSRNPFFPKFFLSVGDWTTRVWNEDLRAPLVTSPYNASYLTGGAWSPSRPGVFYTISHEGSLEAWDYYYKQREPVLSVKVADRPLTSFALQAGAAPRLAGVGAADGGITILQLSEGLVEMQDNEKAVISAVSQCALGCSSHGSVAGSSVGQQGGVMNCTALVQCSAVQCSAVQGRAVQGRAGQCTAVHGSARQGSAGQCRAGQGRAGQGSSVACGTCHHSISFPITPPTPMPRIALAPPADAGAGVEPRARAGAQRQGGQGQSLQGGGPHCRAPGHSDGGGPGAGGLGGLGAWLDRGRCWKVDWQQAACVSAAGSRAVCRWPPPLVLLSAGVCSWRKNFSR